MRHLLMYIQNQSLPGLLLLNNMHLDLCMDFGMKFHVHLMISKALQWLGHVDLPLIQLDAMLLLVCFHHLF